MFKALHEVVTRTIQEAENKNNERQQDNKTTRRRVLKGAAYGSPLVWTSPIITSVVLPVHAQTTNATTMSPMTSTTPAPKLFTIGDVGPCGGIVYEISNGGINGKEAAPFDQGTDNWNNAQALASNYLGGGCTDWYLPNLDELLVLYFQKDVVGGFSSELYWSSAEFVGGTAYTRHFNSGTGTTIPEPISDSNGVRAIRAF